MGIASSRSRSGVGMADATIPDATSRRESTVLRRDPGDHVHHPGHRRQRLRRQPRPSRPCSPPAIGSWRSSGRPTPGQSSSTACRRAWRDRVERGSATSPARRRSRPPSPGVDAVLHLVAIPRDRNGGARAAPRQHRGDPRRRRRRCRRPASGASSTWARWASADDPELHYASSKAKAEAIVRESGLDWTILKPSLQFGRGRRLLQHHRGPRPAVAGHRARCRATAAAASSRSTSTTSRGSSSACLDDPTTIGETFDLGGPRYWTYREITARGRCGALGKRRPSSRCRCR